MDELETDQLETDRIDLDAPGPRDDDRPYGRLDYPDDNNTQTSDERLITRCGEEDDDAENYNESPLPLKLIRAVARSILTRSFKFHTLIHTTEQEQIENTKVITEMVEEGLNITLIDLDNFDPSTEEKLNYKAPELDQQVLPLGGYSQIEDRRLAFRKYEQMAAKRIKLLYNEPPLPITFTENYHWYLTNFQHQQEDAVHHINKHQIISSWSNEKLLATILPGDPNRQIVINYINETIDQFRQHNTILFTAALHMLYAEGCAAETQWMNTFLGSTAPHTQPTNGGK